LINAYTITRNRDREIGKPVKTTPVIWIML
jgi:hypothetical protein